MDCVLCVITGKLLYVSLCFDLRPSILSFSVFLYVNLWCTRAKLVQNIKHLLPNVNRFPMVDGSLIWQVRFTVDYNFFFSPYTMRTTMLALCWVLQHEKRSSDKLEQTIWAWSKLPGSREHCVHVGAGLFVLSFSPPKGKKEKKERGALIVDLYSFPTQTIVHLH